MERFRTCFADLADPRTGNAQRHELDELVMIALLATLCGAESCVDMALFGRSKEALLRRFLRLANGIPSHDTFSRVFRRLDPAAFEACFARYVAALAQRIEGVVAVDGKTARRSFDRRRGQAPLHLISAWACEARLVLGQLRVDDRSNEIPALPELLAMLALEGCIVTADAMHCQDDTARTILARGAVPIDVVLPGQHAQIVQIVPVPEVLAAHLGAVLLADRHMLEAGQIAVAAEIERPEPDRVQGLLPLIARVEATLPGLEMGLGKAHRRAVGDRIEQRQNLLRLLGVVSSPLVWSSR